MTRRLGDGSCVTGVREGAADRGDWRSYPRSGELVDRAWRRGVQVMVEGGASMPYDQIATNMTLEKRICRNAPFYVLESLVTDVAPGYDHITAAIGGTLKFFVSGADFLCYVTPPAEHLAAPTIEDVHTGVITSRIAAHAADLVRNVPGARDWRPARWLRLVRYWIGMQMELAIDPDLARAKRGARNKAGEEACSMCGDYCAVKIINQYF